MTASSNTQSQKAMKPNFGRRVFLRTLAGTCAATGGYYLYRETRKKSKVVRTIGAPQLPPPRPVDHRADETGYSFFAVGDSGMDSPSRLGVIEEMARQFQRLQPDSIFLLGDNFYERGVTCVDDPQWQRDFEIPFAAERFDVPFYACLGNHDYFGNVAAQIEYGRQHPRWNMPSNYYSFAPPQRNGLPVQFFVLDTTVIDEGDYSTRAQIRWLVDQLEKSSADYKIVVGHHPLYSGGEHGRSRRCYQQLAHLFDEYKIQLYVCGHDHDLQLHDTGRGWLQLISGAGSKLRSVQWIHSTLFARAEAGFCRVLLAADRLAIEFYSPNELIYAYERPTRQSLANRAGLRLG